MTREGYFEFFGEIINPDVYRAQVEARMAAIAMADAEVFSGNLDSLKASIDLHNRIQFVNIILADADDGDEEEVEERED